MTVAGNIHAIYMSLDDSPRRITNQALFEHINVYEVGDRDARGFEHPPLGGRYWDRTSDLLGVNEALSR